MALGAKRRHDFTSEPTGTKVKVRRLHVTGGRAREGEGSQRRKEGGSGIGNTYNTEDDVLGEEDVVDSGDGRSQERKMSIAELRTEM